MSMIYVSKFQKNHKAVNLFFRLTKKNSMNNLSHVSWLASENEKFAPPAWPGQFLAIPLLGGEKKYLFRYTASFYALPERGQYDVEESH